MPFDRPLEELIVPEVGGPPDFRITDEIPPELANFDASLTFHMVSIWRLTATSYYWEALVTLAGSTLRMEGTYDTVNGVRVSSNREPNGNGVLGNSVFNTTRTFWDVQNHDINLLLDSADPSRFRLFAPLTGDPHIVATSNADFQDQAMTVGTKNGTGYTDLPGAPSLTIEKMYPAADTDLKVEMHMTGFANTIGTGLDIGIEATPPGGNTIFVAKKLFSTANERGTISGVARFTGLDAGQLTMTGRWKRSGVLGNIQTNADDYISMWVSEVAVVAP